MTQFIFYTNPTLTLACVPPDTAGLYSIADTAHLTGVHPEMLRYYCRRGLLGVHYGETNGEPFFNEHALQEVKHIEHYRRYLGVNRRALPLICELRREGERRQIELRFLHNP